MALGVFQALRSCRLKLHLFVYLDILFEFPSLISQIM